MVAGEALDELARLDDLLRVEPGGRLVEDEHVGVVDDAPAPGRRAAGSPSRACRSGGRPRRRRACAPSPRRRAPCARAAGTPLMRGDEASGTRGPSCRDRAAASPAGSRCAAWLRSAGRRRRSPRRRARPLGRRHVAGQDAHRRRLAGAVRAEEAEDLAALDAEADIVDGRDAAVALGEVLNLNHELLRSVCRRRRCRAARAHEVRPSTGDATRRGNDSRGTAVTQSPIIDEPPMAGQAPDEPRRGYPCDAARARPDSSVTLVRRIAQPRVRRTTGPASLDLPLRSAGRGVDHHAQRVSYFI